MRELHAFDLDDTLFASSETTMVLVLDEANKIVKKIPASRLSENKLSPGQRYDFREFCDASVFSQSKPMKRTIGMLRERLSRPGTKVEIVTARSDLDCQRTFSEHLGRHGINTDRVHVRRAGNLRQYRYGPDRKYKILESLVRKYKFKEVHLYDDLPENLAVLSKLKRKFPSVAVFGHLAKKTLTNDVLFRTRRYD